MEDERRAVLERVARGELSPAEAAALLDAMQSKPAAENGQAVVAEPERKDEPEDWATDWSRDPEWSGTEATVATAPPGGDRAARVRISRPLGEADVVGDPTVVEAVAEGPHVARREGDTLVIEADTGHELGVTGFVFGLGGPRGRVRPRHVHRRQFEPQPLRVRVNPDLPLEIDVQAGQVRVQGVHGPIRAKVQAGKTDIYDFRGPLDLTVQMGSLKARGRLDSGASRVRCDAGAVRMRLEKGSSVRVSARNTLGNVVFAGEETSPPWVVGGGQGTLDIEATMGDVRVSADR